jgi:hypothetical protein
MSVDTRRFAAATRTAASKTGSAPRSRLKLTLTWLTIATALTFFTFTMVATAANSKPDYAGAVKQLAKEQGNGNNGNGNGNGQGNGNGKGNNDSQGGTSTTPAVVITNGNKKEVCSVNESQLATLQSNYAVGWMTVDVDGTPTDLVTVAGAQEHDLHQLLGNMTCTLVKDKKVFYLPFDPTSIS